MGEVVTRMWWQSKGGKGKLNLNPLECHTRYPASFAVTIEETQTVGHLKDFIKARARHSCRRCAHVNQCRYNRHPEGHRYSRSLIPGFGHFRGNDNPLHKSNDDFFLGHPVRNDPDPPATSWIDPRMLRTCSPRYLPFKQLVLSTPAPFLPSNNSYTVCACSTPVATNRTQAKGTNRGVGVDDSSTCWLGSVAGNAPLLDLGSPGFDPRSGLSFLFLQGGRLQNSKTTRTQSISQFEPTFGLWGRYCNNLLVSNVWALPMPSNPLPTNSRSATLTTTAPEQNPFLFSSLLSRCQGILGISALLLALGKTECERAQIRQNV
jgi:hypothetical protein